MKQQQSGFIRWTNRVVIVSMLSMVVPVSAFASLVSTDQAINHLQAEQDRAKIMGLVEREDVRAQLQSRGVSVNEAKSRVNAMTDDEIVQVAEKMDQMPAGGEVLELLFTIFIVLLVTDILGFTKVFPFTRAIKRQ